MDDTGLELADGIEAKQVILTQLAQALEVIRHHDPASQYPGFHAMAVAALIGHGHPEVQALLPATVSPDRVALVGLHAWAEDDIANVAHWGIRAFSPDDLRATTQPLGDWLAGTGCSRVAIHFDVDTIDSNELVLGQQLLTGFPLLRASTHTWPPNSRGAVRREGWSSVWSTLCSWACRQSGRWS